MKNVYEKFITHEGCTFKDYHLNTWRTEQERERGEMTIYMARVVMVWNG